MNARVLTLAAAAAFALALGRASAEEEKTYVGYEVCLQCHQDMGSEWQTMCWRQPGTAQERQAYKRGCEVCHGPGSLHADTADAAAIVAPGNLPPKQQSEICLQCHSRSVSPAEWNRRYHGAAGVSCMNCHSIHGPQTAPGLLKKPQPALCLDCHPGQNGEFRQFSHHPVNEGRLTCSSCHPWYAEQPTDDPSRTAADLCLRCHKEKRGPFLFEHDPVVGNTDDACLTCHASHGSSNEDLLRLPPRPTCLQCHSDRVNHFSGQECASCHTELHGSNTAANFINVRSAPRSRAQAVQPETPTNSYHLSYAYNSLDVDGNFRRFFRYSFPPSDRFFLQNLTVWESDPTVPEETKLSVYGLDANDQTISWKTAGLNSLTQLGLDYSRYNFFRDFTPNDFLSQRLQSDINLLLPLSGTRGVSFSEAIDNVSGSPAADIAYTSSISSMRVLVGGRYGGWVSSSLESFQDGSATLFDRDRRILSFEPSWQSGRQAYSALLEVEDSDVESNAGNDRRTRFALSYARDIAASTSLHADLSSVSRPETIVRNGYTKRTDTGQVSLLYASGRSRLSGGYRRTDMDRRNRSQTVTEPVSFDRFWLKALTRPATWMKIRASYDQRVLDQSPTALNGGLSAIPNLVPDEVKKASFRAEANLGSWGSAWAEWASHRQQLDERNTSFRETADRVGVSGGLPSGLGFAGSYANVKYSSASAPLAAPLSDYNDIVLSLWYPVPRGGSIGTDYSIWDSDGENQARERSLGIAYRVPLRRGASASVQYQLVKDSEAGPLDFTSRLLSLSLGSAF